MAEKTKSKQFLKNYCVKLLAIIDRLQSCTPIIGTINTCMNTILAIKLNNIFIVKLIESFMNLVKTPFVYYKMC